MQTHRKVRANYCNKQTSPVKTKRAKTNTEKNQTTHTHEKKRQKKGNKKNIHRKREHIPTAEYYPKSSSRASYSPVDYIARQKYFHPPTPFPIQPYHSRNLQGAAGSQTPNLVGAEIIWNLS